MDVVKQLDEDLKEAVKIRDEIRLTALRLLKSSLQNYQIEVGHELSAQEVLSILQKEAKKHQDSVDAYKQAGREDLAETEQKELEVLEKYLPQKMPEKELDSAIDKAIKEVGAKDISQMGEVIKKVMAETQGRADGRMVSTKVKQILSN